MNYCAESDPQAARLLYILNSFRHVVTERKQVSTDVSRPMTIILGPVNSNFDPIAPLFAPTDYLTMSRGSRKNSFATAAGLSPVTHKPPMPPPLVPARADSGGSSGSLPAVSGASPASLTGLSQLDTLSGRPREHDGPDSLPGDTEFDFDSLWAWSNDHGPHAPGLEGAGTAFQTAAAAAAAPGIPGQRFSAFAGFAASPSTTGEPAIGLNANVPLYAPSQY
jgi:hypothetical protein